MITCEGMRPVITLGGTIRIGRLAIRAITAKVELGAVPGATLRIGDGVFINQGASIVAYSTIEIGDGVKVGDFVAVYDSDYHPLSPAEPVVVESVKIGCGVWLGRGVIVLPGAVIGDYAVIGAGSVVRGDIPPRTLAVGNPIRVVRELDIPKMWKRP